jgi:hypothetical protein
VTNEALLLLGQGFVSSLEESSQKAEVARVFFDSCRRSVLSEANWNAAIKRMILPLKSGAPEFGWSFQYRLPNNCARITGLYDSDGNRLEQYEYDLEGDLVLTNEGEVRCRYVDEEREIGYMPREFTDCVAALLASKMAAKLTGSNSKMSSMFQLYMERLDAAKGTDAVQDEYDYDRPTSTLERIR